MLLHECAQGSPEWHLAKVGVISASNFRMVRTKVGILTEQQEKYVAAVRLGNDPKVAAAIAGYKTAPTAECVRKALAGEPVGDWSDAAKNYAFKLACERIAGEPVGADQFETWAMKRGRELEEACRRAHEKDINMIVDLAGFITTDDRKFGCSADSLVDPDGGGEYKCFYAPESVRPVLTVGDWGEIMDQVQGCMWLTGRKWWDMCLYFPALASVGKDFTRKRIARDDNYIEALEQDLMDFDRLVCEWETTLRAPAQIAA